MRPISSSAFVAGNFLFVYKNCCQLSESEKQQNELNDVLFSHSIHPNSGAEFPLLFSVISHQPDDYVCPICLFPPVAPRITHCGHIFCDDCISQHMSICEEPLCPICYKKLANFPLIRTDLRLYPNSELHFLFRKIIRSHKNCVCFRSDDQNLFNLPTASQMSAAFCHFMLADKEYVKKLLDKEKAELASQLEIFKVEYNDELKLSFIQGTIDQVSQEKVPEDDGPSFFLQESKPTDYYRYYQDSCGRLIYFDPMTIKMLSIQFGSIADAPETLEVDALKLTTIPVDQRFRDRHRSLGHLPAGAAVTFVLADLSKIVSSDVMEAFSARIEKRIKVEDETEVEEEVETLTEADFPAMFTPKQPPQRQISQPSGWSNLKVEAKDISKKKPTLDEEFPSFGGANFAKKKTAWGSPQSPPPPQKGGTMQQQQQQGFPSFNDISKNPK